MPSGGDEASSQSRTNNPLIGAGWRWRNGRPNENDTPESNGHSHHQNCQLQACNVLLSVLGALGLGLAGTQFQPRIGIDNYRQIDLRLSISILHLLAGMVGFYCVGRSFGSLVLKTLYVLSVFFAIGGAVFYGFTTYKIIDLHRQLLRFEHAGGASIGAFGVAKSSADFVPKTIISSAMIGLQVLAAIAGLLALALLDRLTVVERSWYPAQREDQVRAKFNKTLLAGAAVIKLLTGIAAMALTAFVEFENGQLALRQDYYRIVLDHLSALLAVASAVSDMYACYNKLHGSLNLKVSIALSMVASVWSFKSLDNNAFPFYKMDINQYRVAVHTAQTTMATISPPQYAILISHGVLLGLLALLALLSACTAILAANALRECIAKRSEPMELQGMQNRCFALLHCFWALCLLVLALLGLTDLPWNGDFIGADLLWLALLVFAAGILGSANKLISTTVKFVMNVLALAICVEKAVYSANLIFQSATHADYTNPAVFDARSRLGQLILHGAQCAVLTGAALTALCGTAVYGRVIRARTHRNINYSGGLLCCCSLSALFYAVTMIGSEVFFELDKWGWSEIGLEQTAHYRIGNGLIGLIVFIVQVLCCMHSQFLASTIILQLVLSSLALFTLNSAITNVYYLQVLLYMRQSIGLSIHQRTLIFLAIGFAAVCALACVVQLFWGTISILRMSYLLHHWRVHPHGTISSIVHVQNGAQQPQQQPLAIASSYCSYTVPSMNGQGMVGGTLPGGDGNGQYQSPALHQIAIQPIEEQTLYWSAEDNPYIYKSTKRVYGQPVLDLRCTINESGYGGSPSPRYYYQQQRSVGSPMPIGDPGPSTSRTNRRIVTTSPH